MTWSKSLPMWYNTPRHQNNHCCFLRYTFYLSSLTWGVIINYVVVHYIFDLIFLSSICIFIMLLSCRINALSLSPLWNPPTATAFLDCLDNHSFSLNLVVSYEQHTGKESMSVSHWSSGSGILVLRGYSKTLAIAYSFLLHSDTSHQCINCDWRHMINRIYLMTEEWLSVLLS